MTKILQTSGRLDHALSKERASHLGFPGVNDAFIKGGIDAKKSFYLGSNPDISNYRAAGIFDASGNFLGRGDFPETVFFHEMRQLRDAGYRLQGDYMVPLN